MKLDNGDIRLSASDLMRFMSCAHASALDLERLYGRGPVPVEDSEDAELLQRHGDAHEAAHLEKLRREGDVVEVDKDQTFADAVAATEAALRSGARIVFQGALEGDAWGGWSDFLERVEKPSALGNFSYEVADTKLKRKPDPKHLLQLVLYSDLLKTIQGVEPEFAHVILGDGRRASFRLAEYAAYARNARQRLEAFTRAPRATRPIPVDACALCCWREHCEQIWETGDSLFRIAGITRSQVSKIEAAGVTTMSALAEHEERVARLAEPTLERLRLQAKLQKDREKKGPHHVLRSPVPGKGFDLLHKPDQSDLFYDIEGDPFYSENGVDGLEYLHGVWDGAEFTPLWAHDLAEERAALLRLFEIFDAALSANPGAHIYHYAPYEITALRRLCTRHGVGEAKLDRWLRERRFCDLYGVVRGGIAASEKSYSIKDMEALYGFERTGEVKTAGGSVVAYERWRETDDKEILDEIEAYNRLDCISTQELRDWLIVNRPAGQWPELSPPQDEKHNERDAEAEALRSRLESAGLPEGRAALLYDIAQYHPREAKPAAWAVFDAAARVSEELCDDMDCLGGLTALGPQEQEKQSWVRIYRFPEQETKLRTGGSASIHAGERFVNVSLERLERRKGRVKIKIGKKQGVDLPDHLDLLPKFALRTDVIQAAIARILEDQTGSKANLAADDLLARRTPRFVGPSPIGEATASDPVAATLMATETMDSTVLPVQGPPGTGKTFVTARAILNLVHKGKRVGVASNSHAAIRNVLKGCMDALAEGESGLTVEDVELAHKEGTDMEPLEGQYAAIQTISSSDEAVGAQIVGGTAWLFSHPDLAGAFDYLFVDEAGQVSLANALAMTSAARNLVLVGDPNQLPQVVQGAHPHPANLSCLDWMLGDHRTIPPEHGLFLPVTRRMHPDVCAYISEQFYEDRLFPHETTAHQRVLAPGMPSSGAFWVPVVHEGRAQECPEEIDAIREVISRLTRGTWTDRDGTTRPLTHADIIVVAPYNVQVNALADALPEIRVGTVDKFQGQEAPVALVSMTASSAEETSRGIDFLLSRERLNVAISRCKALSLAFASPRLRETSCTTVEQMRLVNTLCALPEMPAKREAE